MCRLLLCREEQNFRLCHAAAVAARPPFSPCCRCWSTHNAARAHYHTPSSARPVPAVSVVASSVYSLALPSIHPRHATSLLCMLPTQPGKSSIAELEKKLRYLLKRPASDSVFSDDLRQARVELRDALELQILRTSDGAAAAAGKGEDLEGNLWKLAHYKIIEEFRKAEKGVYSRAKRAGQPADRNELRLLTANFRRFLSEATAFYARFICRLHRAFDLTGDAIAMIIKQLSFAVDSDADDETVAVATPVSEAAASRALKACHRSLIYLGDLARYREHHADRKATNWSAAVMFYNMAIRLIPENGNPYNQLAVIASHLGDELRAMECYTRSLAAERPFGTASENLQILFEKVNKRSAGNALESSSVDSSALQERFIVLASKAIGKNRSIVCPNLWLSARNGARPLHNCWSARLWTALRL
ncbi:hypothetical protein BDZ88DRAFT_301530 [Geranomyces variabilis]|nr:hypothetical protein BDZ88DRAFT_301530 [Geranomyces variabilis]